MEEVFNESEVPEAVKHAVHETELLIAYIARYSPVEVDTVIIETLIQSKYMIEDNKWNFGHEVKFWKAYDKLASTIEPVTIESLKDTMPSPFREKGKRPKPTAATVTVFKYRMLTTLSLILLLLFQIYWINGTDLTNRLAQLFKQIEEMSYTINKSKAIQDVNEIELSKLITRAKELRQEFGASYQLLQTWNRVWQTFIFEDQFQAKVTNYLQQKHEEDTGYMRKEIEDIEALLKSGRLKYTVNDKTNRLNELKLEERQRKFEHEFNKERNKLFLTRISAEFVIRSLQTYGLPLLYGLLGALIFTLRSLAKEIKALTYTHHADIRYRLRISMGMLGGMAVGWFRRLWRKQTRFSAKKRNPQGLSCRCRA